MQLSRELRSKLHNRPCLVYQWIVIKDRELLTRLPQRLLQVTLVDVTQLVRALAWPQEVCGEGSVMCEAAQLDATSGQHVEGCLGLMEVLRRIRGQPLGKRCVVLRAEISKFELEAFKGFVDKR